MRNILEWAAVVAVVVAYWMLALTLALPARAGHSDKAPNLHALDERVVRLEQIARLNLCSRMWSSARRGGTIWEWYKAIQEHLDCPGLLWEIEAPARGRNEAARREADKIARKQGCAYTLEMHFGTGECELEESK